MPLEGQSAPLRGQSPQALNNWGLVLQDLASLRAPSERAAYLARSVAKFRRATRAHPAFDRACYNLGTVLYADACARQEALLAGDGAQQQQQQGEVRGQ